MNNYPLFEGKPLIPTKDAQREMDETGIDLWGAKEILEKGYDCSESRRARNVVEKCVYKKNREIKVVAALVKWQGGAFWRIIHAGKTGGH